MTCSQCGCSHTLAWHEETAAALAAVEKRAAQVERQYVTLNETVHAKLAEAERERDALRQSIRENGECFVALNAREETVRAKLAEAELEIEAFKENQGILLEGLSDANACAERLRAASRALLKLTTAYWEARSSEGFSDEECAIGRAEENLEAALAHGPSSLAIAARIAEKERP